MKTYNFDREKVNTLIQMRADKKSMDEIIMFAFPDSQTEKMDDVVKSQVLSTLFHQIFSNDENELGFKVGDTVIVVKDDPMDERVGIAENLRWKIGERFIVQGIDVQPYGTFLLNGVHGQSLSIKRAAVIQTAEQRLIEWTARIRLYFFNDTDTVAAETVDEAFQVVADLYSNGNVEEYKTDYSDDVEELTAAQMEEWTFVEDNEDETKVVWRKSFRQKLNEVIAEGKETFPFFFASTEY